MVNYAPAGAADRRVLQCGEKAHAVLAAVWRRFRAEHFRAGGKEVVQANGAVVTTPRLDAGGQLARNGTRWPPSQNSVL